MSTPEFRLSIDVTVTGGHDGMQVAPLVNEALQELTNRMDFRGGTIQPGRAISHKRDFDTIAVTVDVFPLRVEPGRPA